MNEGNNSNTNTAWEYTAMIITEYLYTTFTENTNFTITPIKFGIPPFTNSPNPQSTLILDDGFEFLSTNLFGSASLGIAPPTVVSGWVVESGTVDVHASIYNPPNTGLYSLDSSGYNPCRLSTNLFTEAGVDYLLSFAFLKNVSPTIPSAQANVYLDGGTVLTNLFIDTTNGSTWTVTSLVFTAQSPVTKLVVDGLTPGDGGVIFDTFTVQKLSPAIAANSAYFLPEEPLTPFIGERAFGPWTLEVWDSRLGAVVSASELLSWRLEIAYPQSNPPLIVLTNGQSFTIQVNGDGTVYFAVPVTCPIGTITNTLQNLTGAGGLDLSFNQFTLPTNGPNDVLLLNNVLGIESTNLTIGTPPLALVIRYYLAVRNTDPTQTNQFSLRFDEVCGTNNAISIDTNASCRTVVANSKDYFVYDLPPGVVAVNFEIYNLNGNADLYARPGLTPPIPGLVGLSNLMAGTAGEVIQTTTNTPPYYTTPGPWTLLVVNDNASDVNYCIKITEIFSANVTRIPLGFGLSTNTPAGETGYFVVNVDSNYCNLFFSTGPHSLPLDLWLYVAFGHLPSVNDYFGSGMPAAVSVPTSGQIGDWFIAVVNTNAVAVSYTVQAATGGGICPTPFAPVLKADSSSYTAAGFQLRWAASPSDHYQVQYTGSLAPINWQTITNVITSGDGNFEFLDTGATTNVQRFYRLIRVP